MSHLTNNNHALKLLGQTWVLKIKENLTDSVRRWKFIEPLFNIAKWMNKKGLLNKRSYAHLTIYYCDMTVTVYNEGNH